MNIMCVNPKELFSFKRLDLVVKYLFAKEILESENNDYVTNCYQELYIRHILMRTMGMEPDINTQGNYTKEFIQEYISSFKKLINSIKENGFNMNYPIPVNEGLLEDGAHRVAASLLLGKNIYVTNSDHVASWDFNWFCENGFNIEDKQRILKGFVDINKKDTAIFVVWNPLFKYIDNVKAVIGKYFNIVGDVDLDFEDNCIAFTNAILEIYEPNISKDNDYTTILEKAKLLQYSYLSFKVIVVTNQIKNKEKDIKLLVKDCKNEIRDLFDHILPKETFCTVHSSDGEEETTYLANILLSPNNIKHLRIKRILTNYASNFSKLLITLKEYIKAIDIKNTDDICIVGSSVMTSLGIKDDCTDIDFIIKNKYREKFGWGAKKLNEFFDIATSDKNANRQKNISDDIVIDNSEYHFYHRGLKFLNLELLKDRKAETSSKKDLFHLRQIDLFEKMLGHFNQQKILFERVEMERQRRLVRYSAQPPKIYGSLFEKIFSVKNVHLNGNKYKMLTIMGIKIKFKKKQRKG